MAFDTVATDTPAAAATSWMVGRRFTGDSVAVPKMISKLISKTFDVPGGNVKLGSPGARAAGTGTRSRATTPSATTRERGPPGDRFQEVRRGEARSWGPVLHRP